MTSDALERLFRIVIDQSAHTFVRTVEARHDEVMHGKPSAAPASGRSRLARESYNGRSQQEILSL
jgi:hypothetical protein